MRYFVVFLISLPVIIDGYGNDQIMDRMESCCDYGTEFAYNGTSEDCSSAKVPYDMSISCDHVSEQCCLEYKIKKAICEKGILKAKILHLSMSLKETLEKDCFDQCKLGAIMGKSYAITSCNVTPLRKSPEHLLLSNAFSQCCKAAATDGHDNLKPKPNISAGKDITHNRIVSSMPSMCEEFAPHELCTHRCIPVPGSYKCECNPGFELMSDKHSCQKVEINRCDSHNTCQHECIKNGMENKCSCRKGYQLLTDKFSCEDINECALGIHDCDRDGAQYQCVNIPGSYRCEKRVNILFTPSLKVEAADFQRTTSAIINPTPTVIVPPQTASIYFTSDIMTNRSQLPTLLEKPDIDECAEGGSYLCDHNRNCFNEDGSYKCYCKQGFELDLTTDVCVDIDECAEGTHLCNQYQNCFNTNGSYECCCKQGFKLDSTTEVCVDIDECATREALCGPLQVCTNLPGGYTCSCPAGHKLVGDHVCEDVDECNLVENAPICSQNAECINTVGSYQCRCHQGFETAPDNAKVCVDVDECTKFKHSNFCMGFCLNEPGSYRCSCPSGYRLSEDKRSCIDIDECETGEAPCASGGQYEGSSIICLNTQGGYRCQNITCPPGYKLKTTNHCTKIETYCPPEDLACFHQPSMYSYNYKTLVSNLSIPESKVDLFRITEPSWSSSEVKLELRVVNVDAPLSVKEKADINAFLLIQTDNQAVISLVRPLEGPQSIELELSIELYSKGLFGGISVAKFFIYVSEYEF